MSTPAASTAAGHGPASKKASTACTACQSRKSKCTGGDLVAGIPCDKCRARGTECVIDESTDGRRKMALKRKQQDWEDDRYLLIQLVETLRDSDEQDVAQLVNVIRSNATLEEIKLCIDSQIGGEPENTASRSPGLVEFHAQLSRLQSDRDGSMRRRGVMDMHRLVDTPLFNVPASPWTTITDDDHLVSHLVSLWFTWSAPWHDWIQRDLFLLDMQSGVLGARCCSPFLVNAMLAHACPYSDYPEVRTTTSGMSWMMEQFLREAKRLLDQEAGRASLTTVQGLGILYQCVSSMGKDRQGWIYVKQLVDMLEELEDSATFTDAVSKESVRNMGPILDYTRWGLWIATSTSCLVWHKKPAMDKPVRPRPKYPSHGTTTDVWTPYPEDQPKVPGHAQCLSEVYMNLMWIVTDATQFLLTRDHPSSRFSDAKTVGELHTRLDQWYRLLPSCLAVSPKAPFQVLFPHLYYHHLIIILYSYLKESENANEPHGKSLPATISSHEAHRLCIESAIETARLLKVHQSTWGITRNCDSTMQWTAVALFTLLDEDLHIESTKSAFVDLCIFARSFSRRWTLGKGIVRSIQLTARKKERDAACPILPLETQQLFGDFERHAWRVGSSTVPATSLRQEFSSFYPNLTESLKRVRQERWRELDRQKHPEGAIGRGMPPAHTRSKMETAGESPPVIEMDKFLEMYDNLLITNANLADDAANE